MLLVRINEKHGTRFVLQGKYATGQNQGAYTLSDDHGARYVLKWNRRPSWQRALERAQRITAHLASEGVPVPTYVLIDTYADDVLYWIQTALPGASPPSLRVSHAEQLMILVDRQAGQALGTGSNWSEYVRAVVYAGHSGWRDSLAHYNDDTRAVLSRLTHAVADSAQVALPAHDICHGDLVSDNVLVYEENVTGIVDWDAAGEGDRALDFSKLLFSSYRDEDIRRLFRRHILDISGQQAYAVYLVYNILAQLDWSIHHHSAQAVAGGVALANQMLGDLEAER